MLDSLAEAASERVKKVFGINWRVEGHPENGWIVVDFGDVVLHLYSPDMRSYYQLEDLWSEGKVLVRLQ